MIIYEANETDFFNNGLGTLPDATSALVTEERNGEFVLDVIYPQQGLRSELLTKSRIIKADAGHELKDQRFVIKKVTPTMDSDGYIYLTVHAEHVSYITADLGVTPNLTLSGNATQALEQWQANLVGGHPDITVDSDIVSTHETNLDITKTTNARQALGGVEGSILDTWGGEYKFDNLHISLRGQRGTTANTLISYGRNLLTFEQEDDITDTYTSIYPYANVGLADGNSSKLVTVDGYFVDSQYVDRYPNRKLLPVDFGSEFTDYKIGSKPSESDTGIYTIEAEIKKKLVELAKQYIENNRIGIPKVSTKITFADLSKTSEYAPLEQVNLCDIIPIRFEKLGIDTTIKVTRVVWNVLLDEYDSIELGDLRTTLGESISALESKTTGLASAVITAQSTADNQNSIFRTNGGTAEPVAKKVGDLWFKTDGDYQYMYQWDGAVWHEVVNTKTTDDIAKEVDQARVKMEELVKKANDDTSIFRTEGQEPTPTVKKKGDLWFKTDNGQTVMHEWDGQKWHEIVSTKTTEDITKQVEQAQLDLAQVRADATRISETQTESAKRLDEQMKALQAKTSDNATNVQKVIRDVAQAHADYVNQQADISKQKEDLEKTKQSLQTTSQGLDQTRQDLLSNSARLNKLEVGVDGVSINVNNLNAKVDNIKIGGTNLIRNSGNPKTIDGWAIWGANPNHKLIVWSHPFWKNLQEKLFALFNRDSDGVQMKSNRFQVERNTEYTLSYWAFEDSNVISSNTFFLGRKNGETSDFTVVKTLVYSRQYSGAKAEYVTVTFNTGDCDNGYIRFDNNGSKEVGKDAVLFLANIKLEKGNRATDYSPAPEDLIEKVVQFKVDLEGIRGTVANAQGDIAQIKLTENGMQQNIRDAQGNISTLQNDAKGFKQQFTDVDGNIANLSASAKTFELQMQDAQGNISSLQNDTKGFKQQFADTNGNIATIKRNATELSEQLASKVGNTEYQSFKTQTAKELSQKLVRTDLNGYATTAEVKLTADGLKEQYNSVKSKVDGLKIGGVNLLNSTKTLDKTDGNVSGGLRTPPSNINKGSYNGFATSMNAGQISSVEWGVAIEPGETYTFSFYAKGKQVYAYFYGPSNYIGVDNGTTPNGDFKRSGDGLTIFNLTSEYKRYWITWKVGEKTSDSQPLWKYVLLRYDSTQGPNEIWGWQLEKGIIPSDWGPSAKDIEDAISGVSKDLTNYKAVVERDYAKNSSVYTKNEVVTLTNNSKDSAVNAIKNDTNWKGLININTNSAFLQTADGFEKEVVKKATPMVEGGGVNLMRNTTRDYVKFAGSGWTVGHPTSNQQAVDVATEGGETYTFSAWVKNDSSSAGRIDLEIYQWNANGENKQNGSSSDIGAWVSPGEEKRLVFTKILLSDTTRVNLHARNKDRDGTVTYWVKMAKVEKGTVVTPWTPAPEDLATVVSVNKVIDTADSHTQIIKDYLTNDNSQFKLLKNAVNLKVTKGDVIGQINLEAGKTLLQNQKIYLDADTVAFSNKAFIPSAAITDLSADKITTGTLNAAKLNVINLSANSINAGTLSGAYLHITKDSYIDNASIDGAKIKSLDAGKITTGTLNAASVKVINLDANNIKTGTLTGPGMALDLNNGSFKINNSDNSLKVEMDSGELRFYRQRNAKALTGTISASDWAFLSDNQQALNLTGQDGVILKTENFKMTNGFMTSGWFLTTADVPSSDGSAVILHNNDVKIVGQTNSQISNSRIAMMAGKPYTCKLGGVTSVEYTGIDIIGSEDQSGVVDINGGNEVRISGSKNKIDLNLGGSSLVASVANSSNYDDTTRKSEINMREDAIYFNFIKDKEDLTPLALYNGGTVRVKDLSVWGSKNAIVQTTAGWTKINAYETAEYYFGDLGTAVTDDTSTVRIGIEPLFNETVNTNIPYQVFVTSYGKGYAWVAERGSNYFVIKSSVPNLEIGYEIKAKRKGYENVRLEIDEHMEVNK